MTNPTATTPISPRSLRPLVPALLLAAALVPGGASARVPAPKGGVLAPPPIAAPLSLTASDGSGLELVSLSAQAVIEDPLAFTELHLVFRNPEPRVREGRFRITLPSGATISRFAMRIGDRWQEGEVVEQQAARIAYEDFLHRRQDPALLEAEAGNEFAARVFPIPPRATKELIVSYSQELTAAGEPYRLPLRGLPKLGQLAIRALVSKAPATGGGAGAPPPPVSSLGGQRAQHEVVQVDKRDFLPDRDFEVALAGSAGRLGLRHDNLVVARVVPLADGGAAARDEVASLAVLVDTSASRALGLGDQIAALDALLAELRQAGDPKVTVVAFDQDAVPIATGKASTLGGDALRKRFVERRALGASDIGRGLDVLGEVLKKDRHRRVLVVTDGVATAGDTGADRLRPRVKALGAAGIERLDVLAVGGIREDALLARLVTAGLARDGVVLDATRPAPELARRMLRTTRSGLKVEIDGAGWVWPTVLAGVQPGDEVLLYADLPQGRQFRVKVGGAVLALSGALAPVERPLLQRAWVKARISRLLEQRDATAASDRDLAEALKKQVIELSVKNRVLSPFTSLLVLETEQDYARFGIQRRALADILTVGPAGIALARRTDIAPFHQQQMVLEQGAGAVGEEPALDELSGAQLGGNATGARTVTKNKAEERRPAKREAATDRPPPPRPREVEAKPEGPRGGGDSGRMAAREAPKDAEKAGSLRGFSGGAPAQAPPPAPPPPATTPMSSAAPSAAAPAPEPARPSPADRRVHTDDSIARNSGESSRSRVLGARPRPQPIVPPGGEVLQRAPLGGPLGEIYALIKQGRARDALGKALAWREREPGDVLALVALGESWEALGDMVQAARAYGSIIDLFPGRADMRRFAGERLERVRGAAALALAADTYRKAVEQRPDHPASHRLLAFALLKQGRPRDAFEALVVGLGERYPDGRFAGVDRILREDLGLAAAAWMRAEPSRAAEVRGRMQQAGGMAEHQPSLRFVLSWETDANDVDFHIYDGQGGHAYYGSRSLPSGGELYADVTTGYGPECFTVRAPAERRALPYRLQAHYYSRGPMGYGMGKLQIIDHDGKGGLRFEERPFVILEDGAYVDLGTVNGRASGGPTAIAR